MSSFENKRTPSLSWYQSVNNIIFDILIQKAENLKINITDHIFEFTCTSNKLLYEINFELFDNINKEESSYIVNEKYIKVILKKNNNNSWVYLTKDKNIYKNNIKVNWNEWDDSDGEENNQNDNQNDNQFGGNMNFDFQEMMKNMGGLGNEDFDGNIDNEGYEDGIEEDGIEEDGIEEDGIEEDPINDPINDEMAEINSLNLDGIEINDSEDNDEICNSCV
jgi:hypothetical protein